MLDRRLRTRVSHGLAPIGAVSSGRHRRRLLTVLRPRLLGRSPRCSSRRATRLGRRRSHRERRRRPARRLGRPRRIGPGQPARRVLRLGRPTASPTRCVFGGVAWYLGRTAADVPMLAFAAVALAMLISYERAKAEGLGYDAAAGSWSAPSAWCCSASALAFDVLVPGALDHGRADGGHRGAPVREGVAPGVGSARPARSCSTLDTGGPAPKRPTTTASPKLAVARAARAGRAP